MGAHARKVRPQTAQDRYAAGNGDGRDLGPREVLETLEAGGCVYDDIAAARGIVNAAMIGSVLWALALVTYYVLS